MRSSGLFAVFATLFLTSTNVLAQSWSCQNGLKACGSGARITCTDYCEVCVGGVCACYNFPADGSCTDDTPCLDLSRGDFECPAPGSQQAAGVAGNGGNGGGDSINQVTSAGNGPDLSSIGPDIANIGPTITYACPAVFHRLGWCS